MGTPSFRDKPASTLFAHDEQKIACLSIRGTATIQDVVTDIRAMPVPFPQQEDEEGQDRENEDEEERKISQESPQEEDESETLSVQAEEQLLDQILSFYEPLERHQRKLTTESGNTTNGSNKKKRNVPKNKSKSNGKRCQYHPHIKLREQNIQIQEGKTIHISCPACCIENKDRKRRNSDAKVRMVMRPLHNKNLRVDLPGKGPSTD